MREFCSLPDEYWDNGTEGKWVLTGKGRKPWSKVCKAVPGTADFCKVPQWPDLHQEDRGSWKELTAHRGLMLTEVEEGRLGRYDETRDKVCFIHCWKSTWAFLIYLFNKHPLRTYHMPDTVLRLGNINPRPLPHTFLMCVTWTSNINIPLELTRNANYQSSLDRVIQTLWGQGPAIYRNKPSK